MGDNVSDNSWKILLAKTNNAWKSTIKIEDLKDDDVGDTTESWNNDANDTFVKVRNQDEQKEDPYDMPEPVPQSLLVVISQRRQRKGCGTRSETDKERSARLARMSAYAAQRLARETPEQRATRLKRMSEYAAKRLALESPEQRAKRLARMSEYAAKRISEETPEQRKARLTKMSMYAARRHAMKKGQLTQEFYSQETVNSNENV